MLRAKRHKRSKRPVKIYYIDSSGKAAGNMLTNAHVLSQFYNIVALLLAVYEARLPTQYKKLVEYRGLFKGIEPDRGHPVMNWVLASNGNLKWFAHYAKVIVQRYTILVPNNKLAKQVSKEMVAENTIYGVEGVYATYLGKFPHQHTWGNCPKVLKVLGEGMQQGTAFFANEYYRLYHKYGVFCHTNAKDLSSYPASFREFMDNHEIAYTAIDNAVAIKKRITLDEPD